MSSELRTSIFLHVISCFLTNIKMNEILKLNNVLAMIQIIFC